MSIPQQGREPLCMCVRVSPNSHIPKLLGGNLIREDDGEDRERQEGGWKENVKADLACDDRNRREGE